MTQVDYSCLCGALSIKNLTTETPTLWSVLCHCESCRKAHAALFVADFSVSSSAIEFPTPDTNENCGVFVIDQQKQCSTRYFCKKCGTRTHSQCRFSGCDAVCLFPSNVKGPKSGSELFPPTFHVNYQERLIDVKDKLPKFNILPPMSPNEKPNLYVEE